jgi:hypothetical protein
MNSIVSSSGEMLTSSKRVSSVTPFGSTILIENLNPQEILETNLYVDETVKTGTAPQAYIVALGPKVDAGAGLKVGDRVIVQGSFVPVPNTTDNGRIRGVIEMHNIKAVLVEE